MSSYCIKVRRRGTNYYTGAMERYFENLAVRYGYHLTKRIEQADLWCVTFLGNPQHEGGPKWITFSSDVFNNIAYERLEELARLISECFKSESVIETADQELLEATGLSKAFYLFGNDFIITDEIIRKYGEPILWLFSREHSAFDEPPIVSEGETILRVLQYDVFCVSDKPFTLCIMNTGGPSRGLTIDFCSNSSDEVEIENLLLTILNNRKGPIRIQPCLERVVENDTITCRSHMPEFNIQAGFNQFSSAFRGKNSRGCVESNASVWISFVPRGSWAGIMGLKIEITPNEYPDNKLIFSPLGII